MNNYDEPTIKISGCFCFTDELEIDFCAEVTTPWYDPGQTYGDPYNCYPPESGGGEPIRIWHDNKEGNDIDQSILNKYSEIVEETIEYALEKWALDRAVSEKDTEPDEEPMDKWYEDN